MYERLSYEEYLDTVQEHPGLFEYAFDSTARKERLMDQVAATDETANELVDEQRRREQLYEQVTRLPGPLEALGRKAFERWVLAPEEELLSFGEGLVIGTPVDAEPDDARPRYDDELDAAMRDDLVECPQYTFYWGGLRFEDDRLVQDPGADPIPAAMHDDPFLLLPPDARGDMLNDIEYDFSDEVYESVENYQLNARDEHIRGSIDLTYDDLREGLNDHVTVVRMEPYHLDQSPVSPG